MRSADLLSEAHHKLGLKLGFRLWDGHARTRRLGHGRAHHRHRRRGRGVLAGAPAAGRHADQAPRRRAARARERGSIFDLAASRRGRARSDGSHAGSRRPRRCGVARLFFFVDRGPRSVLDPVRGDELARDGRPRDQSRQRRLPLRTSSNDFYRLFLDERDGLHLCLLHRGSRRHRAGARRDKLDMICRKLRLKPGERFLDNRLRLGRARLPRGAALRRGGARRDPRA